MWGLVQVGCGLLVGNEGKWEGVGWVGTGKGTGKSMRARLSRVALANYPLVSDQRRSENCSKVAQHCVMKTCSDYTQEVRHNFGDVSHFSQEVSHYTQEVSHDFGDVSHFFQEASRHSWKLVMILAILVICYGS